MHYFSDNVDGLPAWSAGTEQRLLLAMLPGTIVVLLVMMVLRFPPIPDWKPVSAFILEVILEDPSKHEDDPQAAPESTAPVPEVTDRPVEVLAPADRDPVERPGIVPETVPQGAPATDWNALAAAAVRSFVDAGELPNSINPPQDEKRRAAASRYRPSRAPEKKPIWENVEVDALGRKLLRSGNCYRVLDNPTVTNRWYVENFEQYMVFCGGSEEEYLIEFDAIPDRYVEAEPFAQ